MYNTEVLRITCSCFLMYYFHIMGTVSILGTVPVSLILRHIRISSQQTKLHFTAIVFIYLNFFPTVIKLYLGSSLENIWLNVADMWLYTFLMQLVYEVVVIWFGGHVFQQKEVLYAGSIRLKNIIMLLFSMSLPVAILQGDLLGMYTFSAAKWNIGVLAFLFIARRFVFDYVTKKISNGVILRLFFRLVLGIFSLTSDTFCQFVVFHTSIQVQSVFLIASITYILIIGKLTDSLISNLDIL